MQPDPAWTAMKMKVQVRETRGNNKEKFHRLKTVAKEVSGQMKVNV